MSHDPRPPVLDRMRGVGAWTALAVLITTACSDAQAPDDAATRDPAATEAPRTSSPDDAPAAPSAVVDACAGKTGSVGDTELAITAAGLAREATLHVPSLASRAKPMPLVLVLHPLLLKRQDMRKLTDAERFADDGEHGFLALFPDGIDRSWNAGECCGKAKDQRIDDVGFIRELVEHVKSKWCVDPTRIYAMGFSNGAFLTHRLACELPGGLRAIAAVAGTLGIPEAQCTPPHPTPVLQIHGTEDALVPFLGGPPKLPRGTSFGTFASPAATDAFWTGVNGCAADVGGPYFTRGEVSCVRHESCREGATTALCTVTGGGHQWPGASALPAMGHVTKDMDATAAAVELFRANGL